MKNICFITGTRAEYGLMKELMLKFKNNNNFNLQIIATGSHLSKIHGETYHDILYDGFEINKLVDMKLNDDTELGILKSMSIELSEISNALSDLKPNIVIVLGDRYEILIACISCLILKIDVAHIAGGDITEGVFDNKIRNAISQIAKYHFTTNIYSQNNLIKMGINEKFIYNYGNPGLDYLINYIPIEKESVFIKYNVPKDKDLIIIIYHPVTLENNEDIDINEILESVKTFREKYFIIIGPNSDTNYKVIIEKINNYKKKFNNLSLLMSVPREDFLSIVYYSKIFMGNSSAGLYEIPFLNVPVINLGNRQKNRVCPEGIVHIDCKKELLIESIIKILSRNTQIVYQNPYFYTNINENIYNQLLSLL